MKTTTCVVIDFIHFFAVTVYFRVSTDCTVQLFYKSYAPRRELLLCTRINGKNIDGKILFYLHFYPTISGVAQIGAHRPLNHLAPKTCPLIKNALKNLLKVR